MAQPRPLAVVLALAGTLAAQQQFLVVPNHRTSTPGNSADGKPFAYDRVRHEQYIGRSQLLPLGSQALLYGIAYRPDGGALGARVDNAAAGPAWAVRMANVTVNPADPGSGLYLPVNQLTTVFAPRAISWPIWQAGGVGPLPFNLNFPFDAPFAYRGGHLAISHYSYNQAMQIALSYFFDAEIGGTEVGTVTRFGAGCPAGANATTGFAPNPGGGDLALYLHQALPQAPALAFLGTRNTSYAGQPLPLDLTPIGLPGCALYTGPIWYLPTVVQASGLADVRMTVPGDPALAHARLFGQFLVGQDPRVSPLLAVTLSAALDFTLGAALGVPAPEMATVAGTLAQANAAGGVVFPGEGLVVRLQY